MDWVTFISHMNWVVSVSLCSVGWCDEGAGSDWWEIGAYGGRGNSNIAWKIKRKRNKMIMIIKFERQIWKLLITKRAGDHLVVNKKHEQWHTDP